MSNKLKSKKKECNKHVNHNPQAESVKSTFGEPKAKEYNTRDFKI